MTTAKRLNAKNCCRECGLELGPLGLRKGAVFCKPEHRKAWNNRRMIRGAELYDIVMAIRYDREFASTHSLMTLLSNQARAYRDADNAFRDSRDSWNIKETMARIPLAYGKEGDKR